MDYEQFENDVKTFFEDSLDAEIAAVNLAKPDFEVPSVSKVVNGYPDPLKQSDPFVVYFFLGDYDFEALTSRSSRLTVPLNIYVVIKGLVATTEQYDQANKRISQAIDSLIVKNKTLKGLVDMAYVDNSHLYESAEGAQTARASRKIVSLQKQISD